MSHTINLDMPFELRRQIMAACKPYESFDDVIRRVALAALSALEPAPRTHTLKRSPNRWPLCITDKQWYSRDLARFIAECRALGYTDTDADLAEMFDDSAAMEADSTPIDEWRDIGDVNVDVVRALMMSTLHQMPAGTVFDLQSLAYTACPRLNKLPGSTMSQLRKITRELLTTPQFVRAVTQAGDIASSSTYTKV